MVEFNSYEKIEQISLIASQLYYKYSTLTRLFNIDADARVDQIKNDTKSFKDLGRDEIKNSIKMLNESRYFLDEKIKQSTKKIAKLQQHLAYVADVNLFLDYCNFIKTYKIEHVHFFVFSCLKTP